MSVTAVPLQPTPRRYVVLLWIGIVAAIVVAAALAWMSTAGAIAKTGSYEQFLAYNAWQPGVETTESGLQYQVLEQGDGGAHPTDKDVALISYTGKLRDGTVFDASQQPVPLPVAGSIPGFSEGIKLMTKGAKYRFWINPELGYGERENGPIPPNSLLVFDVELVHFLPQDVLLRQMQMQQMLQGGGGAPGGGE